MDLSCLQHTVPTKPRKCPHLSHIQRTCMRHIDNMDCLAECNPNKAPVVSSSATAQAGDVMTPHGWKPHQAPIALDRPGIQKVTAASKHGISGVCRVTATTALFTFVHVRSTDALGRQRTRCSYKSADKKRSVNLCLSLLTKHKHITFKLALSHN